MTKGLNAKEALDMLAGRYPDEVGAARRLTALESEVADLRKDRDKLRDAAMYLLMGAEQDPRRESRSSIQNGRLRVLGNVCRDSIDAALSTTDEDQKEG